MSQKKASLAKRKMKKILSWLEDTPSPNEGRIRELKEAIAKGRYPTKRILDATAGELILRFDGRKKNAL